MDPLGKRQTVTRNIEIGGWICGFIAALGVDYWILPRLVFARGGKPLAAVIGLLISLLVMFILVEASGRLANTFRVEDKSRRPKTLAEKLPLRFRIVIASVATILTLSMVFNGVDGLAALWRAFR